MTPAEHAAHIRHLELELYKADFGLGMPRDYAKVQHLMRLLATAKREAQEAQS